MGELAKEKIEIEKEIRDFNAHKELRDFTAHFKETWLDSLYADNTWGVKPVQTSAEDLLDRKKTKELAEKQLLENKKKLFEDLGLEWDEEIVKWIHNDRLHIIDYWNSIPNTEPSAYFKKRAELLATYINKHTKLGKLL